MREAFVMADRARFDAAVSAPAAAVSAPPEKPPDAMGVAADAASSPFPPPQVAASPRMLSAKGPAGTKTQRSVPGAIRLLWKLVRKAYKAIAL